MKNRLNKLKSAVLAALTMKRQLLLAVATLGLFTAQAMEVYVSGQIQVVPRDAYWSWLPELQVKVTCYEDGSVIFEGETHDCGCFEGTGSVGCDPGTYLWFEVSYKYRSPTGIALYEGMMYESIDTYGEFESFYVDRAIRDPDEYSNYYPPDGAWGIESYELLDDVDTVNVSFVGFDEDLMALNAPAFDAIMTGKMLKEGDAIVGVPDEYYYDLSVTSDVGRVEQISSSSYWHEDYWAGKNRLRLWAGATDTKFFLVKKPWLLSVNAGSPEHTTHVVLTNGVEVTGGRIYYGQTGCVIYTADPGYVFAGGVTVVTNTLLFNVYQDVYYSNTPVPFLPKAKIGDMPYPSLSAANAAASAGDVITLLGSMDGVGVAASKAVMIDFAGYTYTVSGNPIGSPANVGISLVGASCVLTNGTLASTAESGVSYILACGAGSSTVVSGMALGGDVALAGGNLSLVSGSLTGSLKILSDGLGDAVVTKAKGFAAEAPDGYEWTDSDPQVLVKIYPLGSEPRPWSIGATQDDTVIAWTNGMGKLIVEGAGKMTDFAAEGTDVPWPKADVTVVEVAGTVSEVGYNAWYGLAEGVTYIGLTGPATRALVRGFTDEPTKAIVPTIKVVSARQRYPWNGKVDITYATTNVLAAAEERKLDVTLKVSAVNVAEGEFVAGDTLLTDGTHALVWDMRAQGIDFRSTNVVFEVSCEAEKK